MKQATSKLTLLTLILFFITFLEGYTIGNETEILPLEVSNFTISLKQKGIQGCQESCIGIVMARILRYTPSVFFILTI
jgi:hypothetical protein